MQWNAVSFTLPCNVCGASLVYVPARRLLQCDHCASLSEMADAVPNDAHAKGVTAQAIIPLSVDEKTLTDAFDRYLAAGGSTPDRLVKDALVREKTCFYLPVHAFAGNYDPSWDGSPDSRRKERHAESVTRQENGRSQRIGLSRTRKTAEWRPAGGLERGDFAVLACAADGEFEAASGLSELLAHFDADLAEPFCTGFISGIPVLPHVLSETAAWEQYGKPLAEAIFERDMKRHAQNDRNQGWHWNAVVDKYGKPLLVPIWRVVYEYEGKSYRVWFDGADASHMAGDASPRDRKRSKASVLGWLPFLVALPAAAHANALELELGLSWITLLATLAFGLERSGSISFYSARKRQEALAEKQDAGGAHATAVATRAALRESRPLLDSETFAKTGYDWLILPLFTLMAWLIPVNAPEKPPAPAAATVSASASALAQQPALAAAPRPTQIPAQRPDNAAALQKVGAPGRSPP